MAYTPTEWQSGDIVTSAKLNKIEQGIVDAGSSGLPDYTGASDGDVLTLDNGEPTWAAPSGGAPFIVYATQTGQNTATVDKTFAEIAEAYEKGVVYFNFHGLNAIVTKVVADDVTSYQAFYMIPMDMSGWQLVYAGVSVFEDNVTLTMDMFPLSSP